jgi:hypothetical protein
MPTLNTFRIVFVSPADVDREWEALPEIIEELNRTVGSAQDCELRLQNWRTHAHPSLAAPVQETIDNDLRLEDCDVVIGAFWTRFGAPVKGAASGTKHELDVAYAAMKRRRGTPRIMLYFNNEPVKPAQVDPDQMKKLQEFRAEMNAVGLVSDYASIDEFKDRVRRDLVAFLKGNLRQPRSETLQEVLQPGDVEQQKLKDVPLYTFLGLQQRLTHEAIFQDFQIDKDRIDNPSPVSFLWADAYRGNFISASIEERDPPYLRVEFENRPYSYASNVAIRPRGARALARDGRRNLIFEAKTDAASTERPKALDELFCAARVVNGWCQHWGYGPLNRYRPLKIRDRWEEQMIALDSDEWWIFPSDGNRFHGPRQPNFDAIALLILEFGGGSKSGQDRPDGGSGVVLIRGVRLA